MSFNSFPLGQIDKEKFSWTFVLIAIATKCATQEVDRLSHLPD